MSWQTFLLFIGGTFFISATPGTNMLFAFQTGLNHGLKQTLWVMAGLSFGLLLLLLCALAGLGIIAQYPLILTAIKLMGALYLLYLGIMSWQDDSKLQHNRRSAPVSRRKLFQSGVWVSLSNPKAILFFAAFFPKFIDFQTNLMPQYLILISAFFAIETLWQFIYAVGGARLAAWLNSGKRMLYLNRICGMVFVLIALMLVYESLWS